MGCYARWQRQGACTNTLVEGKFPYNLNPTSEKTLLATPNMTFPLHKGNDPLPAPGGLKTLLLPTLLRKTQTKGKQGVRARHDTELPPFMPIVRHPGRPVTLGIVSVSGSVCVWRAFEAGGAEVRIPTRQAEVRIPARGSFEWYMPRMMHLFL